MLSQQNSVLFLFPVAQVGADTWTRAAAIRLAVFCPNFVRSHLPGGPVLRELGSCMQYPKLSIPSCLCLESPI